MYPVIPWVIPYVSLADMYPAAATMALVGTSIGPFADSDVMVLAVELPEDGTTRGSSSWS